MNKFKKVVIGVLLGVSCLGLTACHTKNYEGQNTKPRSSKMTKKQALAVQHKGFDNAVVIQHATIINSRGKYKKQNLKNTITVGGKPLVLRIASQGQAGKKQFGILAWLDQNNSFVQGKKDQFYKVNYEKLTGHTYADFLEDVYNNQHLTNPPKEIVKAETMDKRGKSYVLGGNIENKQLAKETASQILSNLSQSQSQASAFKEITHHAKYEQFLVSSKFQGGQMTEYSEKVILKFQTMEITLVQKYGNFGQFGDLSIPDETKTAKTLKLK